MTWQPYLDELRLLYAEERDHLEILKSKGKRSPQELRVKALRLELLAKFGAEFAPLVPLETQIKAFVGSNQP